LSLLSRFRRQATTEYFDCAQFDMIARAVGVRLAAQDRFCLKSRVPQKALMDYKTRRVRFDRKWFLGLSPDARCACLVHELWHVATQKKAVRATMILRSYLFIVLPALSIAATWLIVGLASTLTSDPGSLSGLPVLLYPLFVVAGYPFARRRWSWPIEYECDEAAVRFMGADATKRFLKTLKLKSGLTTHPPTRKRLERVDSIASKYQNPVIDFDSLQHDARQNFALN
jgi:hypothetical protein